VSAPPASVVVCTRNRPVEAERCVRSILRSRYPSFECIVVDQSDDDRTEERLGGMAAHGCVRYVRSGTRGLSRARNVGASVAEADVIACTDDDCEVATDWLANMVSAFDVDPAIGLVFGSVLPAPHDPRHGFVPAYQRQGARLARRARDRRLVDGIGSCMGLRRSAWAALGGFDPLLGAGARFESGEDMDLALRALMSGYWVYETQRAAVTHFGFRTWLEGGALIHGYLYGIGAMTAKHLKCGNWGILWFLWLLLKRWTLGRPAVDLGHRPPRWLRLRAFLAGGAAGFRTPVDRGAGVYRERRA